MRAGGWWGDLSIRLYVTIALECDDTTQVTVDVPMATTAVADTTSTTPAAATGTSAAAASPAAARYDSMYDACGINRPF